MGRERLIYEQTFTSCFRVCADHRTHRFGIDIFTKIFAFCAISGFRFRCVSRNASNRDSHSFIGVESPSNAAYILENNVSPPVRDSE